MILNDREVAWLLGCARGVIRKRERDLAHKYERQGTPGENGRLRDYTALIERWERHLVFQRGVVEALEDELRARGREDMLPDPHATVGVA